MPRLFTVLIAALLCLPGTAWCEDSIELPAMGSLAGNVMTPGEEERLGQDFMRQIRASSKVVTDPLLSQYIRTLGAQLAAGSEAAGHPFEFFLIEDPSINAFAGPAGHIGVHTGLILESETEGELAAVLAHEIAHVSQNHLFRAFDEASRMNGPLAAMILAAVLLGAAAHDSDVGAAAIAGVQAGMLQHRINFTRANEQEADHVGMQILAEGGFPPSAMPAFFGRMGQAARLYDSGEFPEFLRTHPVTANRIADSRGRAAGYAYRQRPDSLEFHLSQAALKVASLDEPRDALRHFRKGLQEGRYRNEDAQRYGLVLALMRNRQWKDAQQELKPLLRKAPLQLEYLITQARVLEGREQPQAALETLEDGLTLLPDSYPLVIEAARLALDAGAPRRAAELLSQQLERRPGDALLHQLMAQAAGDSGKTAEGYIHLAEYHYLSGELEAAVQKLEAGLQQPDLDYYQSARMAARLKELRKELFAIKQREGGQGNSLAPARETH